MVGRRKIRALNLCQSDFKFAGPKNTRIIATDFAVAVNHT